jgi:hypothetical protein
MHLLAGHPCQSTQARTPPASCSSLEPAVSHSHQHPLFSSKASIQASQTILVILAPWPAWPPWPWPPWPAWPLWLTSCRTWSLISKQVAQHACRTHENIHCYLHSEVHVHAIISCWSQVDHKLTTTGHRLVTGWPQTDHNRSQAGHRLTTHYCIISEKSRCIKDAHFLMHDLRSIMSVAL